MISEKQLAANRSNAETDEAVRPYPRNTDRARSTPGQGPKTEEGKKRSRLNALRHGITGQVTTMTDEDRAAHDQFSKALIQRPRARRSHGGPTRPAHRHRQLASQSHQRHRGQPLRPRPPSRTAAKLCPDDEQIDAALTTARVFTMESKQLQLLTLYEQRLNRAVQKNLAMLQSLQATRKAGTRSDNEGSGQPSLNSVK